MIVIYIPQTGQNDDFTVEFNTNRPVCPRDGSQYVPGRGPVCPTDSSCLSRTPSRPKCFCLLFIFLSDMHEEGSGGSPSDGHNPPRGSPRKFASQRALRGLSEGSAGSLRGLCGGPPHFPRFFGGSDPMLVTLGNCSTCMRKGV